MFPFPLVLKAEYVRTVKPRNEISYLKAKLFVNAKAIETVQPKRALIILFHLPYTAGAYACAEAAAYAEVLVNNVFIKALA